MPQHPFPDPGPDGEEPDSSMLPPEAEGDGPENDRVEPAEQGLYVCLPAEQLTLAGFAQGGQADTMTPGPLLATIVDTVTGQDGTGLAGCSDDQLMGIISAARRIESLSPDPDGGDRRVRRPARPGRHWTASRPVRQALAPDRTAPDRTAPVGMAVPAVPLPARIRLAATIRLLGRAWPRWSALPSPWPPSRAGPTHPAKPTASARWTGTTPATWPPPRPATPAPGGASPSYTPTAPPPPTAASLVGVSRPAPGPRIP